MDKLTSSKRSEIDKIYTKKRVQKYQTDPAYREQTRQYTINRYHKTKTLKTSGNSCERYMQAPEQYGVKRNIFINNDQFNTVTFSKDELGKVLGNYTVLTVRGWVKKGVLPPPIFTGEKDRKRYDRQTLERCLLYTLHEVEALLPIFFFHQQTYSHLRVTHKETVNKIHVAIQEARNKFHETIIYNN